MAAKWLVNQKDNQLSFDGLQELAAAAKDGRLRAGDLVQPPGANDWVYANEVPELKAIASDDVSGMSDTGRTMIVLGASAVMVVFILIGMVLAAFAYLSLPDGSNTIVGGEHGVSWGDMIVTQAAAPLHATADAASPAASTLEKDAIIALVAKQNGMWQVRTPTGQEGFVTLDAVLPAYQLGPREVQEQFDPIYNPERYVSIGNAAWNLAEKSETKTVFRFMLVNTSKHEMENVKLAAIVKDDKGAEVERVEFAVEGKIPHASESGNGQTFVGTLKGATSADPARILTETTFMALAQTDPAIQTRWTEGVEFEMKTKDFSAATIDIIGVAEVPGSFTADAQ
jgi:hypothetical protein